MSWDFRQWHGSVGDFHNADLLADAKRTAWFLHVERDTIALGSHQSESDYDPVVAKNLEIEVVRRRSGGGAVWLPRQSVIWVDLIIPSDDSLWSDDVREAALWVGQLWQRAIEEISAQPLELRVASGALKADALGEKICFVSEGPGEVMSKASKVVGISQRRSRTGARFQCCAYTEPLAHAFAAVMGLDPADAGRSEMNHCVLEVAPGDLIGELQRQLKLL